MVDSALRTRKATDIVALSRRLYVIKPREPWELPNQTEEIPAPPRPPQAPGELNLLSILISPALMVVIYGIMFVFSSNIPIFFFMMPLLMLGQPIGSIISHKNQLKKYREAMQVREQNYRVALAKTRARLEMLAKQQREALDREYPLLPRLVQTGLGISHQKRLWWRRMADPDFLSLRMGTGSGRASFTVSPPRSYDPDDPLVPLANELAEEYKEVPNIPLLLDFLKIGSVGLEGQREAAIYGFARRLVLDIIVHHSPQDVQVVVLADTPQAQDRWNWLKWTPHTRAIYQGESLRRLAFSALAIDKTVEWLAGEYESRRKSEAGVKKRKADAAIFVLLDDSGDIRRTEDIRQLAESGQEADIYLMFLGGRNWPRECRAKINVSEGEFKYTETFAGEGGGRRLRGQTEPASLLDCERVARALAGWELSSGGNGSSLPETVRLSELFDNKEMMLGGLKQNWTRVRSDDELLQFPFGLSAGRKGLEPVVLNLLPDKWPDGDKVGGLAAYHTLLVGFTGSGKSEFMKSLVMAAAYLYSPRTLNFFFMDFKGGAAFDVLKDLPHFVGLVTNLEDTALGDRALSALLAEIERRQRTIKEAGCQNIWQYNAKNRANPLPHLLLLLDEFTKGVEQFERLPGILDTLVRQGRSLGMYMLLANQDVNAHVERLLSNVGWRIALKVANDEDMHVINRKLPKAERTGQGYLLHVVSGNVTEFQAAYAGFPIADTKEETPDSFKIYQIEPDGRWQVYFTSSRKAKKVEQKRNLPSEQDLIISLMKEGAKGIEPARLIYLDPLPDSIPLEMVLDESAVQRVFEDGRWQDERTERGRLVAAIGYIDQPEECVQDCLHVDFETQDGHLWIVGAPGSGKAMTLTTILLSLALTHTPEEVQYYILEFGAGSLQPFEDLPHTGAVIRLPERERLERLVNYLNDEMDRRTAAKSLDGGRNGKRPALFLVINNYAELQKEYPDYAEQIPRFIRDGKAAGLHVIVTTNRGGELFRAVAGNIAKRIVLQLGNRDEYMDLLGRHVPPLSMRAEGRGYWPGEITAECQIARPSVVIRGDEPTEDWREVIQELSQEWRGARPQGIGVLESCITLDALMDRLPQSAPDRGILYVPVGMSYEGLETVSPNLLEEIPQWLVLGPPRSGKSNFLVSLVLAVLRTDPDGWEIKYFAFRRSPLDWIGEHQRVTVIGPADEAVRACKEIGAGIDAVGKEKASKRLLILMDDLGVAFEPGKEELHGALNALALKFSSRVDLFLIASGTIEELRLQMSSPLVRSLRQSRTGMTFSRDSNDLDWLGAKMLMMQYRNIELPPGRGFWVSRGKAALVQTPWAGDEPPEL
ncbi:MAG: FtsK/SpoIIIE domain-containing protein [Chloroflexota bacterium]